GGRFYGGHRQFGQASGFSSPLRYRGQGQSGNSPLYRAVHLVPAAHARERRTVIRIGYDASGSNPCRDRSTTIPSMAALAARASPLQRDAVPASRFPSRPNRNVLSCRGCPVKYGRKAATMSPAIHHGALAIVTPRSRVILPIVRNTHCG